MYIDSHCHLADDVFAADLDEVVDRARDAGVETVLCILAAGDAAEAAQAVRLLERWPDARLAIGVHPHQAGRFADTPADAAAAVRNQLAASAAARAVGEIGLDYHYDFAPREVQQAVFRAQVRLARECDLPIVVHTREAEADTFAILEDEGRGGARGIFHCFTGDAAMARRAVDLGFHVSFSGIVTFPAADAIRGAAQIVPAERLLVETDSPYLAPAPHRGRRNEPARVVDVVEHVAHVRRETAADVAAAARQAFRGLLRP